MRLPLAAALALSTAATVPAQSIGAHPSGAVSSPRHTPLVRLVASCVDAVVSIRIRSPDGAGGPERVGTGSVLHRDGYVLTNHHVVDGVSTGRVQFRDGTTLPFEVVATLPHEDLAVLHVAANRPLPSLPLGRSHDLLLGEPVVAIGDAAALPFTVSQGIVSGLDRATATEQAFLPAMLQTDAAINGGNSGGPLVNALGQQIGVVTSRRADADNVAFAITADHVRALLTELLAVDARSGLQLGFEVEPLAEQARIAALTADGPAARAGLSVDDVVTKLGTEPITGPTDLLFAQLGITAVEPIRIAVLRGDREFEFTLTPEAVPAGAATELDASAPGLDWALYEGAWSRLPDFGSLEPSARGDCTAPAVDVHGVRRDDFALLFSGFVELPADGAWQFGTTSDDGSRLWIDGELVVDNDGLHGRQTRTGTRRLASGLHALRVAFFERGGAEVLEVSLAGPGQCWATIPATAYRRR